MRGHSYDDFSGRAMSSTDGPTLTMEDTMPTIERDEWILVRTLSEDRALAFFGHTRKTADVKVVEPVITGGKWGNTRVYGVRPKCLPTPTLHTDAAWETVLRELQDRADRLAELPHDNEHARLRLEQVCGAIIDLRREWQRGDI